MLSLSRSGVECGVRSLWSAISLQCDDVDSDAGSGEYEMGERGIASKWLEKGRRAGGGENDRETTQKRAVDPAVSGGRAGVRKASHAGTLHVLPSQCCCSSLLRTLCWLCFVEARLMCRLQSLRGRKGVQGEEEEASPGERDCLYWEKGVELFCFLRLGRQ